MIKYFPVSSSVYFVHFKAVKIFNNNTFIIAIASSNDIIIKKYKYKLKNILSYLFFLFLFIGGGTTVRRKCHLCI